MRKAIASLVGTVAKHELPTNTWPEFFQFVTQHVQSADPQHHEVRGIMFIVSIGGGFSSVLLKAGFFDQAELLSMLGIWG